MSRGKKWRKKHSQIQTEVAAAAAVAPKRKEIEELHIHKTNEINERRERAFGC